MVRSKGFVRRENAYSMLKLLTMSALGLYIASLYVLAHSEEYNIISRLLFALALGLTVLNSVSDYNARRIKVSYPTVSLLLFFCYIILSCLWAEDSTRNGQVIETTLLLVLLYCVVKINVKTVKDVRFVLKWVYYGALAMCLYTLAYYGIGTIVSDIGKGIRIGAEINQENHMGFYCAILSTMAFYQILVKKDLRHIPILVISIFVLLGSGSRRGILLFLIGFMVIYVFMKPKGRWKRGILVWSVTLVGIFTFLIVSANVESLRRYADFVLMFGGETEDRSLNTRMGMIEMALSMFFVNPIFGYGPEQFQYQYLLKYGWRRPPHCTYLECLVSYGVIGFVLMYGVYVYVWKRLLPKFKKNRQYSLLFMALFAVFLVSDIAANSMMDKFLYLFFALFSAYSQLTDLPEEIISIVPRKREKMEQNQSAQANNK